MMEETRGGAPLVIRAHLGSAGTAAGGCAWVLWSKVDDSAGRSLWSIVGGFPSNKIFGPDKAFEVDAGWTSCIKQRDEIAKEMSNNENTLQMMKYGFKNPYAVCLPESVDPRDAKGK